MSSRSSSVDKHEKECLEFIFKRLRNAGGSLQLQQITGHMSQLSYDVRSTIGTSRSDLQCFLKRHSTFFSIDNGIVKIADSASKSRGCDSDSSDKEAQSELPSNIEKGKGVIVKIMPRFGFIKVKEPIKTVVFFKSSAYGNNNIDLTSSLYIGAMVYFNAEKPNDFRGKYSAIKVWKVDESDIHSSLVVNKPRKNRDSGLYDPMTLDGEGVIQNVFPNLGFIAVKGDEKNTVFFHKNRLLKYDNIVDLTKVLSKGDLVEFSAHRSTKQDAKARWEATKVWKKSSQNKETCDTESDKNHGTHSSLSKIDMKSKHGSKEMIKNQKGKICPRSQGAVIKFGQNELADGDASVYYISGCEVKDISWEFSEGQNVFFDAVKIKSAPGWKAVLVWIGEKPDIVLPTCLGDFTEFTDDETEDNLSSYMSYSSNSSVKSECSSFKNRKIKKETSSSISNFSVSREDKKSNLKGKLHLSKSQYSSRSSLSSLTSKSSQKSKIKSNEEVCNKYLDSESKATSSWGDSPYPADDDYNNISPYSYESNLATVSNHNKFIKVPDEEVQSKIDHPSSVEKKNGRAKNQLCSSLNEVKNEKFVVSESKAKVKAAASLKIIKCVEGKIMKVYSKFAEVKAKGVENIFSFLWNNFYVNGVSFEELELDNLKQVLKIGDTIHLNYFEIVDDSGQNWQKVSLAWKDSKPIKVTEITPEDFIKQNNLSVSINYETAAENKEEENTSCRKYLTAVTDVGADKLVDEPSSESCTEDELLISTDESHLSKLPNKIPSTLDYKMMSTAVIEILKKDLFPSGSEVDYNSITEEILNVILENHDLRKCDDKFCQTLLQNENTNISSNITCTDCGELFVPNTDKDVNRKNSEVQTIITGEIIAQNIFTES